MRPFDTKSLPATVRLTGSDCFHLVLDKHAANHLAGGNVTHIAFYFSNLPDLTRIKKVLKDSPVIYWLSNIQLEKGRFFFNTPCWRFADAGNELAITEHRHLLHNEIPDAILQRDMPLQGNCFLACDVIYYPDNQYALVLSWNHILMDGKGIGMLVQHLNESYEGEASQPLSACFPTAEEKVSAYRYIRNMYKVKKFVMDSSAPPIVSVAGKKSASTTPFKNRIVHFTAAEMAGINENAFQSGARFGPNLFYLSCCAHAVNTVNKQRTNEGVFWIPVPYDGRLRGSFGPIISNKVAYLFYRVPKAAFAGIKHTVACMAGQMTDQIKNKMPQKYSMLLDMMRHLPLSLYYYWVNKRGAGSFASFIYSFTGDNFNEVHTLFGQPVTNLVIYPSPTFPPGLTFFFLKHKEALNINMVYSPDILNNFEIDSIEQQLRNLLLQQS